MMIRRRRNRNKIDLEDKRPESVEKQDDKKDNGNVYAVAEMQHQEPVSGDVNVGF
jgi:hypothetical protein